MVENIHDKERWSPTARLSAVASGHSAQATVQEQLVCDESKQA